MRLLASLPNLKCLDCFNCVLESAHELFQVLPDFASLTELALPDLPDVTDWGIVAEALMTSRTLETVDVFCWERVAKAGPGPLMLDCALIHHYRPSVLQYVAQRVKQRYKL